MTRYRKLNKLPRYKGFNLINEPRQYSEEEMTKEDFIRVITDTV